MVLHLNIEVAMNRACPKSSVVPFQLGMLYRSVVSSATSYTSCTFKYAHPNRDLLRIRPSVYV